MDSRSTIKLGLAVGLFALAIGIGAWRFWGQYQVQQVNDRLSAYEAGSDLYDHRTGKFQAKDLQSKDLYAAVPKKLRAKLEELDARLKENPNDRGLLATKIHIGMDYAPGAVVAECRQLLKQDPKDIFALNHIGYAYLYQKDLDRAIYYASKSIQVKDTASARNLTGHILFQRGQIAAAREQYTKAMAIDPFDFTAKQGIMRADAYLKK